MKTRLCNYHREILEKHAKSLIVVPPEMTRELNSIADNIRLFLVCHAERLCPSADREVLRRYDLCRVVNSASIRFGHSRSEECVVVFAEPIEIGPKQTACRNGWQIGHDENMKEHLDFFRPLFLDHQNAAAAIDGYKAKVLHAYTSIFRNARYYEDVLAVWPEAIDVADKIRPKQLPAANAISNDAALAIIRENRRLAE